MARVLTILAAARSLGYRLEEVDVMGDVFPEIRFTTTMTMPADSDRSEVFSKGAKSTKNTKTTCSNHFLNRAGMRLVAPLRHGEERSDVATFAATYFQKVFSKNSKLNLSAQSGASARTNNPARYRSAILWV